MVIFARFQGESGGETAPGFAAKIFDPERPGTLTHFFTEMSRGQFALTGQVLPRWYVADNEAEFYLNGGEGDENSFGLFAKEILRKADDEVDFGLYDNDGTDGIPNSGDDDGFVDIVFISMQTVPRGFIIGPATGIARLGLRENLTTNDRSNRGGSIRFRKDQHVNGPAGVVLRGHTFEVTVGTMAHEFGHFLGLPDLFDTKSAQTDSEIDPLQDSAGIGYWGLMAHGTRGWEEVGGPNPFSAWSLERLGWIGENNADLVVVESNQAGAEFRDVNVDGEVRKIKRPGSAEYFLVEHRASTASYYERHLPSEGLLIWEIDPSQEDNDNENEKLVDLVCADGSYLDAGFPLGTDSAPRAGHDNLDFWANDDDYAETFAGNLGDAGDPFDGIAATEFSVISNPAAPSGLAITNIKPSATGMIADIVLDDSRRAGIVLDSEEWQGNIEVVGDVVVPAQSQLQIRGGTRVIFGEDLLSGGADPQRTELAIEGWLVINREQHGQVVLTSGRDEPEPGDWSGITVAQSGRIFAYSVAIEYPQVGIRAARIEGFPALEFESLAIRWADRGIEVEDLDGQLDLIDLDVRDSRGSGVVVYGRGTLHMPSPALVNNGGNGLLRSGGELLFARGELTGNGLDLTGGANMVLGTGTFGEVTSSTFRGGIGIRMDETREVFIRGNSFFDLQVGLISHDSRPQILENRFLRNQVALELSGEVVPSRLELNTINHADRLLTNNSSWEVVAVNNWWGTRDPDAISERILGSVVWQPFLNFDPRNPVRFELRQSYPNPFNASTVIEYTVGLDDAVVDDQTEVLLEVRNTSGALVRRLVQETAFPGIYSVVWDGRDENSDQAGTGVYYYWLRIGERLASRKMMILR